MFNGPFTNKLLMELKINSAIIAYGLQRFVNGVQILVKIKFKRGLTCSLNGFFVLL